MDAGQAGRRTCEERNLAPADRGGTATMLATHQWLFGSFCLDTVTVRLWDGATRGRPAPESL